MGDFLYKAGKDNEGAVTAHEDVSTSMKAVVTKGEGLLFREDYPTPKIVSPKGVLLRVLYSAICHTDTYLRDGLMMKMMGDVTKEGDKYRVLGHEFVAEIVAVGSEVNKSVLGEKVVVPAVYGYCGKDEECQSCAKEQYNLCGDAIFIGAQRDGGLATYVSIEDEDFLVYLSDKVSPRDAFAIGDALGTAWHALDLIGVDEDDYLGVIGAGGGLGRSAVVCANAKGVPPDRIIGTDIREELLNPLEETIGINTIVNSERGPVREKLIELSGGKLNKVIDCVGTGGSLRAVYERLKEAGEGQLPDPKTFNKILTDELAKKGTVADARSATIHGGSISVVGATWGDLILLRTMDFMGTERVLTGPWGAPYTAVNDVLEEIESGRIPKEHLKLLVGKEYSLTAEDVEKAFNNVGKVGGRNFFNMTED